MTDFNITRRAFLSCVSAVAPSTFPFIAATRSATAAADTFSPGARLVWYGETASIPGAGRQLEPDANGQWVDKRTGDRYSEFETPGAAAGGFVVLDLLSRESGALVLWMTALLARDGKASGFIDANGLFGTKSIADYWIAPAELAGIGEANTESLRILRVPYVAGGRSYNAIRIQSHSGSGSSQRTYDLASGVCLASGTTAVGASVLTREPGDTLGHGAGGTAVQAPGLVHSDLARTCQPGGLDLGFAAVKASLRIVVGAAVFAVGAVVEAEKNVALVVARCGGRGHCRGGLGHACILGLAAAHFGHLLKTGAKALRH